MDPHPSITPSLSHPVEIPTPNHNPSSIPPTADLPSTISLLAALTSLADSALKSTAPFLPPSSAASFVPCPFDPRHRMPPESLFRHSLLCPSGTPLPDLSLLESLRYPSSLNSHSHLHPFPVTAATDLCFALDAEIGHLGSNFFYRDCPGVVTTPEPDAVARTFTLPAVLSAECANFVGAPNSRLSDVRILPSELWAVRCEVGAWRDCPSAYSYPVLRVATRLHGADEGCLKKWVISNSHLFGVLIDAAIRDHIFVLLNLCLKAVKREAHCTLEVLLSKDDRLVHPGSLSFECPRLVESLMWLASQLSVLYGETNGKLFAIGMFKESLLHTGKISSLIRIGQDKVSEDSRGSSEGASVRDCSQGSSSSQVFVSQVAAAVAALHERFLLEEKIKMLRFARPPPKYQLLSDYSYALTRGAEERGRRPNYRAVLEHDGLYWHRGQNGDKNKTKTREELLAEERDYKRRRMSYRGKKVKRTPKEVLRDIIEEHMEEIKQAGGIGCGLKVDGDIVVLPPEYNSQSGRTPDICGTQNISYDTPEKRLESSPYKKPLRDEYNLTFSKDRNLSTSVRSSKSRDSWNSHEKLRSERSEHRDDYKRSKHGNGKNYESRSPSSHRTYSHSHERYAHQNELVDAEAYRSKYQRSDSRPKDKIRRQTLTSMSTKDEYDVVSDSRNNDRGRTSERRRSGSKTQNAFEDRYDPSGSLDGYGSCYDDASVGSSYLRSGNSPTNDGKHHDELQRHGHGTKQRHRDHLIN